jgi:hypothetical protein
MTESQQPVSNPFELMMNPEAVFQAIGRSHRLESLHRRVYRPLDKPLIAKKDGQSEPQIELDDEGDEPI